jgi:hypothetical protein
MLDKVIIHCKCGTEMMLDNDYIRKNYNYRQRRFYCANCGNEILFQYNFMECDLKI